MNLDRYLAQDRRQAAIIGQEVQAARRDAEAACVYDESAARASTDASIDQAVLLQIKHVADDRRFVGHRFDFFPSAAGQPRVGISQFLQNFALQVAVQLHSFSLFKEASYA